MPEEIFLALPGEQVDGRQFIEQALARGAVAVLAESDGLHAEHLNGNGNIIYRIKDLAKKAGFLIDNWFGNPSGHLKTVGITGTNGKTSCSHYIANILNQMSIKAGVIGTIGQGVYPVLHETGNTTPGMFAIHELFASWLEKNIPWAILEVTSHALSQGRIDGVRFDTALFTNISRDHLDYHKTVDDYVTAKSALFSTPGLQHAVLNFDDPHAEAMRKAMDASTRLVTFSLDNPLADLYLTHYSQVGSKTRCSITSPWGKGSFTTRLWGKFNLYNLLGVIGVLGCHGFPLTDILESIQNLDTVPGRMAIQGGDNLPTVIVDYAHTPDALKKALKAIQEKQPDMVTCVFGCGGDRDRGKRSLMMREALDGADHVILTSDNPRHESPDQIICDTLENVRQTDKNRITVIPDRKQAIYTAIDKADRNNVILVAGKGHENYQDIMGTKYPMDDSEEVKKALEQKKA